MSDVPGRGGGRLRALAVAVVLLAAPATAVAQDQPSNDLPISPEWLSNTLTRAATPGSVQNNTIPGALQRRDAATRGWRDAVARYKRTRARADYPDPRAKPEYDVVWSSKQNGADV